MFKRVEKRRRKKEEEEELGLNDDMKEVLGMQDTDSDESESDDESEDSSEASAEDERVGGGLKKRKRNAEAEDEDVSEEGSGEDAEDEDEDGDRELDGEDSEHDSDSGDDDGEPDVRPPIPVSAALLNPLYPTPQDALIQACLVCPDKLLKNEGMQQAHIASRAHISHFKKFVKAAKKAGADDDAWDVVSQVLTPRPTSPPVEGAPVSKRAEKRKTKLEKLKKIRQLKKDKVKAYKEAQAAKVAARAAASPGSAPPADADAGRPKKRPKKTHQGEPFKLREPRRPGAISGTTIKEKSGRNKAEGKPPKGARPDRKGKDGRGKGDGKKRKSADEAVLKIID